MRVLHVIPSISEADGGPPWILGGLVKEVSELGVEASVATIADEATASDLELAEDTFRFPGQGPRRYRWSPQLTTWLRAHLSEYNLIHAHSVYSSTTASVLALCRRSGVPVVLTPHAGLMRLAQGSWRVWKPMWRVAYLPERPGAPVALQCLSAAELDDSRWVGLAGFVHAPLWQLATPVRADSDARRCCYALTLSRIHPVKRLDLVIRALSRCDGVSLVIAGVGRPSHVRELQSLAARLGLVHRIQWVGQVSGEEKTALLRGAACLVQASSFESLGVAVLEAMAAGVPVAVSSRVGVADLVQCADAGCVVGDSPDEWANVLQSLVTRPGLWQARAAGAVRWAEALPSMEDCGRELILRYEALLACAS